MSRRDKGQKAEARRASRDMRNAAEGARDLSKATGISVEQAKNRIPGASSLRLHQPTR